MYLSGWKWFWNQTPELWASASAHLVLVVEAIGVAVMIGVPMGVAATRSKRAEQGVMGLSNVLQTIPSLALLGFLLLAFRGQTGKAPALTALVLYALLPIVKNTILGIRSIEPGVIQAAEGMGMTARQRLWHVELPLAVPVLLGGVRLATVASVGMATIAALIGAGGLGRYIFRGVALSSRSLILMGAVPAALMALACDAALGELERRLDPRRTERLRAGDVAALVVGGLLALMTAWGLWNEWKPVPGGQAIRVGSKDSAEGLLLGHMLADVVEARTGRMVDRDNLNLGGTLVCYNAVKGVGLDAYIDYTGTALAAILHEPPEQDPGKVLKRVRERCWERDKVRVLDPLGFENTFAIVMKREQAERLGIRAISDLKRYQDRLQSGFGPEFMNRADGYPGLMKAYGLTFGKRPVEMDRNLLYSAVEQGTVEVAAGDSTDGRIAALDLVVLEDDRRFFPPYEAVPMVNGAILERFPELEEAFNALAGRIDNETMRRLNAEVDSQGRAPRAVAREFLKSIGLLEAGGTP